MKKNLKFILIVLFVLFVKSDAFAISAYSVGCLNVDTNYTIVDTRQLVYDAANGYFQANINSYYNIEPTYSYLNSTTRLGGSRAFFIAGHATYNAISLASRGSAGSEYWTGVTIDLNGQTTNAGYRYVDLDGRNMSNTKVITFAGCRTASQDFSSNLASAAVSNGAHSAVGWRYATINETNWLKTYNYALGAGNTVIESVRRATMAYGGTNTATGWDIYGNRNSKITTAGIDNLYNPEVLVDTSSEHLIANKAIQRETHFTVATTDPNQLYARIDLQKVEVPKYNEILFNEDLVDYSSEFSKLISIIKEYDSSFNINNYKLIYKLIDEEEGFGFIQLIYYIDNNIRTNKIYYVEFNNYQINDIMLTGVRKSNIQNVAKLSVDNLMKKIDKFEKNKLDIISSKMLSHYEENSKIDKSINNNRINNLRNSLDKINASISESYYYDYNDQKLVYELDILRNSVGDLQYFVTERIELE